MKRIEKKEMMKDLVIEGFENGKDVDTISGEIYTFGEGQLKITEIPILVREIGRELGYLIPVKVRNAEAMVEIEKFKVIENLNRDEIEDFVDEVLLDNQVSRGWVISKIKKMVEDSGQEFPKKTGKRGSRMQGWRLVVADAIGENPEISNEDLFDVVRPWVANDRCASDYVNDFGWVIRRALFVANS